MQNENQIKFPSSSTSNKIKRSTKSNAALESANTEPVFFIRIPCIDGIIVTKIIIVTKKEEQNHVATKS